MSTRKLPSLEGLERIPHTDIPEKLDEMLERIEKEDIAFVITEDGEDKYVLCPYAWFDFAQDDDFGCMVNSAIRNELNHPSENVEAVQRFITNHIESFDHRTVAVAIEDIEYDMHFELGNDSMYGFDAVTSYAVINRLRSQIMGSIRKAVKQHSIQRIHLVLATSSDFAFFIAQDFSRYHDPEVIAYQYERNDPRRYTWGISNIEHYKKAVYHTKQ